MDEYHYDQRTRFSLAECEATVGKRAELRLTGSIVDAREGPAGNYVVFEPDERFGFETRIGGDLELFEVSDS